VVNGAEVINLASMNFLGLSCDKSVEDACVDALNKYGCGSCGPRGFYGTIDVHLELEERIAEFIGTEDAILYSYDVATPSSVVPAFAKRGDIVVCDEAVSYPLMNGIVLSRSTMHTFRHNDMQDLERVLQQVGTAATRCVASPLSRSAASTLATRVADGGGAQIAASDKRRGRKKVTNRRFIVTEGVFAKTGDLAPLPQLVALKERYRYRLIVEDSLAVGVLGRTGRGTAEHFDIDPHRVDIITASLSNSLGSIGGFCCGTKKIVDHQRLNGLGYCFSASLPPFLASAAIAAIDRIVSAPVIVTELQDNARYFRQELCKAKGLTVDAEAPPAAVYIYVDGVEDAGTLGRIADACLARGVFLCGAQQWSPLERWLPERPCLRAFVCALHTRQQLKTAAATIGACAQKCRRK